MPAPELRIDNRATYFRKAIRTPSFGSERVLARDAFQFSELWLKRECPDALPFWDQARIYYVASNSLPAQSSPLTSYYCFLNAVKALLMVKGVDFSDYHGVSGTFDPASKRALRNEKVAFKGGGILPALSRLLEEEETEDEHSLTDILSNLPFIHRAYRYTFRSHPELFLPLRNVVYRKGDDDYTWVTADIEGRYADGRSLSTLPAHFEIDKGYASKCVIRCKRRTKWYGRNSSKVDKQRAINRLQTYHRKRRQEIVYISASPDLWYLKREMAGARQIKRYTMTLIMAAMHRLSELSRYDPEGLIRYLEGRENWLLTEFIELGPLQFIDELVCEMTSLEFGIPGMAKRRYAKPPTPLLRRLKTWHQHWPAICGSLLRDAALPPNLWKVRPWLFVPMDHVQSMLVSVPHFDPPAKVTPLEMTLPWKYHWNRKGEGKKPDCIPVQMQ